MTNLRSQNLDSIRLKKYIQYAYYQQNGFLKSSVIDKT